MHNSVQRALFILLFAAMFLHVESMAQTTRYVAVTGDDLFGRNSCINSETPCRTIMRAVTASSGGDTIMVFGGVYTESIILEKSLTILGEGRDVTVIQSHPEPKSGTGRVIAIVEGLDVGIAYLTIRHGNASGSVPDNSGGGVYNDGSSLTLTGVTLSDNSAMLGGGMFTRNVSPVFTDVVFDGNSAISIGGGVYNLNGSPSFMNVIFNNNSADNVGGGIYNETGIAVFTDVHFTGNNAGTGGGMYNWNSSPVLNDVVFDGNSAGGGGGIYSAFNSSPMLTNVSIRNNTASSDGGGMYNLGGAPGFNNVIFDGNSASSGGGIYNSNSTPTFNVVDFVNNTVNINGGGMYNSGSSPTITSVMFTENAAQNRGGGIYNTEGNPAISNVRFEDNSASSGGGMYNNNSNPTLLEVIFTENTVVGNGGGMYTTGNPILTDVVFSVNSGRAMYSPLGSPSLSNVHFINNPEGGMYSSDGSPTLENITFQGNADDNGGGLLLSNSDATLRNVRFIENQASSNGGGMHTTGSNPALINVLLNGNSATRGGGLYNTESSVTLINGSISDNRTFNGGGIYNDNNSTLTLTNSIIWNNRIFTDTPSPAQSIVNEGSSVSDISYSLIEHSGGSGENWNNTAGTDGGNNMDLDPMFVDTGDLRLLKDSPAINAGDPATDFSLYLINLFGDPLDLDGNRRLRHSRIDIGAYEYQGDDVPPFGMEVLVNNDVIPHNGDFDFGNVIVGENASFLLTIKNNGSFQLTLPAFGFDSVNASEFTSNLASASIAPGGSITGSLTFSPEDLGSRAASLTITANDGSYLINLLGTGQQGPVIQPAIDAASDGDVIIIPPGTYNETIDFKGKAIQVRSSDGPEATIIDATGLETSVVSFTGGEGPGSILEGFTITGGTGTVANPLSRGGGIYIIDSNPTIRNCIITGNSASAQGGGMFNIRSNPVLTGVIFSNNTAVDGGGMFNRDSSPSLHDVIFDGNTAENGGGMSNTNGSAPALSDVSIINNTAQGDGGGMLNALSFPSLNNVTFNGNTANNGGGMINNNSNPVLTDVDFHDNRANSHGGGMYNADSSPVLKNVIISGNRVGGIGGGMYNENSTVILTSTVFLGNYADQSMGPGGGMYNSESIVNLTNVTFSGNRAAIGAAIYNTENSVLTSSNVIIWNNMAGNNSASPFASIANGSSSISTVSYSLIANSGGSGENWNDAIGVDGGNNIDADPVFVQTPDPLDAPANTGNVRLLSGSPAIDAGDPDTDITLFSADNGLPVDPDGNPRVRHNRIDMGAYEYQGLNTPQLVSPPDEAEDIELPVTLQWESVEDAAGYRVQVVLSGTTFVEVVTDTSVTEAELQVLNLRPLTGYNWRVRAQNEDGESAWSEVWSFTTKEEEVPDTLAAPQLVSPADGEEIDGDSVTLRWYSVADADSYYVQLSLSGESFEYPHFAKTVRDTSIVLSYLDPQTTFYWRVKAFNGYVSGEWSEVRHFITATTTSALLTGGMPAEYVLHQNYPNPFNPSTVIRYEIPVETYVLLEVYNMLGQRVAVLVNGHQQAGFYTTQFHAEHLTSGVYFYRVTAGDYTAVRKLMLVR